MNKEKISSSANTKKEKKSTFAQKRKFKHGSYAVVLTVAFIVVVILLNIGATVLASKVSFSIDLTANNDYTVSDENKEYIKKIDRDVTITVCCDKDTYTSSYYGNLLGSNYCDSKYLQSSGSSTNLINYFVQNARLLEEYTKLNSHIKLVYADPQEPEFNQYTSKYPNANLKIGNIIVESSFEHNGEQVQRYRVLDTDDTFTVDTATYASYGISLITNNRIETAVTSAIYSVTSDTSFKVALITANGGTEIGNLQSVMEMNNYEFTVIDSLIGTSISDDTDLVIISRPTMDYSAEELEIIDDYLNIDDGDNRALMYIGSADQSDLPNINEFVDEWGFTVTPNHLVYETNNGNAYYSYTNIGMSMTEDNGYIDSLDANNYKYISNLNTPVVAKSLSNRTVTTLLEISGTAVARPNDADENWSASDAELKGPFVGLGVTKLSQYDSNNNLITASFIMLNSSDFITSSFNNYAEVGNISALLKTIDTIVGREDAGISFDNRTIETTTFTAPSKGTVIVMLIIFIGVLPAAILACGIVIWVRRRRS